MEGSHKLCVEKAFGRGSVDAAVLFPSEKGDWHTGCLMNFPPFLHHLRGDFATSGARFSSPPLPEAIIGGKSLVRSSLIWKGTLRCESVTRVLGLLRIYAFRPCGHFITVNTSRTLRHKSPPFVPAKFNHSFTFSSVQRLEEPLGRISIR